MVGAAPLACGDAQGFGTEAAFFGLRRPKRLGDECCAPGPAVGDGHGLGNVLQSAPERGAGFVLYGKRVFRVERLQKRSALSYALMALSLWWCNWAGISVLARWGLSRNLAALLLIPLLAALSYTVQRLVVFRQTAVEPVLK